ncbi:MAG: hypothetical protein K9H49_16890 [Bacteroidales bacterium]|nr:hypothetical protein [Bacteroidales bacterium]MCF8405975.1 hypothetical protein [Bacteroidales bacterium]
MKEDLKVSNTFRLVAGSAIILGMAALAYGFLTEPDRTWANYLLNNYYWLSVALGGALFYSLQYITQSGWSAGFKRIPEAFMAYLPYAAVFFLLLYFGTHSIYHWSHAEEVAHDHLLQHKAPYLNIPFFMARLALYFTLWIVFTRILRRLSLKEDETGERKYFEKQELYSKILIFILAISFTLSNIDWIMSVDPHWFSTIFAVKNLISAFLHGVSIIILLIFILNRRGYFGFLNEFHLHDFSRYIFMLSIVWGYFWFSQFMIIWYGNIPEETSYYFIRWNDGWKFLFFAEIVVNWAIPFFVLLPVKTSKNRVVITIVILFLIVGQYIEYYLHIMPAVTGELKFGIIEIGSFLGFAALFIYVIISNLGKRSLIAKNHPYLNESVDHHF